MRITNEIAGSFIDRLSEFGSHNVNIMDHDGIIIASHDKARLGLVHEGSLEVMRQGRESVFQLDDVLPKGTRPGVTIPIFFHGACVGAVGVTGAPQEVYQNAQIIRLTIESLLEQQDLHVKLQYKRNLMENWVMALVEGDATALQEMENSFELLNIDPESLCCVAVASVWDHQASAPLQYSDYLQREDDLLNAMSVHAKINFHGFLGQGRILCALAVSGETDMPEILSACQDLQRWMAGLPMDASIGIGSPERGLAGFQASYRQALQSVTLIEKLHHPRSIMTLHDWGIVALIDQAATSVKQSFLRQFLDGKPPLSEVQWSTLEVYFAHDQSLSQTALALFIHKNTLLYRLRTIQEALGLDPRRFQDAMILQVLTYFRRLLPQ